MARVSSRAAGCCSVLLACAIAFGCRPARLAPALPSTLPTAHELLAVLARRRAATASVRGFARVAYDVGGKTIGSRDAVVAARPAQLRLEVLGPLGAVAVLTCDGREIALYVRREGRVYRGPATAESVAAYVAVAIPPPDVVSALLGSPPERSLAGPAIVTADRRAGLIRLRLPLTRGHQDVWFVPGSLAPVASETPLPDGSMLRTDFADLRPLGILEFPFRIDLRTTPGERAIHVRYATPSVDVPTPSELFAIPTREGVEERAIAAYAADAPQR